MTTIEHAQAPKNKHEWTKSQKLIVGGLVASVLSMGGYEAFKGTEKVSHNLDLLSEGPQESSLSVDTPAILGDTNHDGTLSKGELHAMDPADIAKIAADAKNLPILVDAYEPDLDKWRQEIFDQIQPSLTVDQRAVLTVPTGPKELYSDQDVINQATLDLADASAQDDTVNGERMVPLVHSPNLAEFQDDIRATDTNKARSAADKAKLPIVNVNQHIGASLPHLTGSFNGVDLSGYAQARIIQRQYIPGPNDPTQSFTEYGLYGLVKSGQNESWQLMRRWLPDNSGAMNAINSLMVNTPK